ncbi:MAG: matrixin family metalloprotease [Myxococcales bacterium]|nr:matrixin family metalloprotease [Myxococcales bacterium]
MSSKRSTSMKRSTVALALACAAVAQSAAAYTPSASKWNPASLPIGYRINAMSAPASLGPTAAVSTVEAGFATWAAPACTTWRSRNDGASALTRARSGDSERSVMWLSGTWPSELGSVNSTIGVTTPVWRSGGYFIDADIQFNAVGFRWGDGTGGTVDTQSIAVHEEGHFLGLDHTNVRGAIMFPSYSGGQIRNLNADDQAGVCFLYPSGVTPPADGGVVPPPDSGVNPGSGAVGDVCNMTTPCAAGNRCVCRSATDCFCSRGCSTAMPCPSSFQCANTSIGPLCVPGGGGTMMGMGGTGDPCTSPDQCSTGLCVRGPSGSAFCSQACTDDCSCPTNFSCFMTSMAGLSVCGPGTNACMPSDAGVTEPDSGTGAPVMDAGVDTDAGADGGRTIPGETGGCKCSTPGSTRSNVGAWAIVGLAFGFAALRRRRAARSR